MTEVKKYFFLLNKNKMKFMATFFIFFEFELKPSYHIGQVREA